MDRVMFSKRKNIKYSYGVGRTEFVCLEINISQDRDFFNRALTYAQRITPNLYKGAANTSKIRTDNIIEIDNKSGLIAELACEEMLSWLYGSDNVKKPSNMSSHNQIDIMIGGKTIEVRSSCVRNGIDFDIFAPDKNNNYDSYSGKLPDSENG